jgi:neutral amino acid transport system ATP-binding protein
MCAETRAASALQGVAAEPGVAEPDAILVANHVRKSFGGLVAVDVDHLEVQRGVITALIGPNGAGKTTFFNVVTGFDRADAGRRVFEGRSIGRVPPHAVARRGLVRTFQLTKALGKMSVMDNMKLGAVAQRGEHFAAALVPPLWRAQEREIQARAESLLERFNLIHMRQEYAATLSGGQRKLLEMARALMVHPKMLMLDEPVSSQDISIRAQILNILKDLQAEYGLGCVFISHDLATVRFMADDVIVMYLGRVIEKGTAQAICSTPAHPYTKALLAAALPPNPDAPQPELPPQGEIPSPLEPPSGCPYHTRCPLKFERCETVRPPMFAAPHGGVAACHLLDPDVRQ